MPLSLWQGELADRTFTFGVGTDYEISDAGPSGLGSSVRSSDIERIGNGSASGYDAIPAREVLIPFHLGVAGDDHTDAGPLVEALRAAWRPLRTGEMRLDLYAPGVLTSGVASVFGRPRGVSVDLALVRSGYASALATFAATDPLIYGPSVASAVDSSSPLTVAAATLGPEDTDRLTITVVGNGGSPLLTNTTTGGVIDFAGNLTNTHVAVIDVRNRTITVQGVAAPTAIDVASTWFGFRGGVENTVTFANCTSVQITYRPAYP